MRLGYIVSGYRNGYLLGFHGGAYRWDRLKWGLFVNGGGGNVNGWASDGNESGYVSKPGYVRDVEFGYGDEEDDARFLSLGERMRGSDQWGREVDIKYSFKAEKKEKKGSSTMRIVEIEEPPSNQRVVVFSQCQKETYIMNLRENVTYDCERELAEERYGEDDKAL
ncbi:DNA translocase FtsK [Bienertia sinuspersici]